MFQARRLIDKRATSADPFMQLKRGLERTEENYVEELRQERRQIIEQKDKEEQIYRKKSQELTD